MRLLVFIIGLIFAYCAYLLPMCIPELLKLGWSPIHTLTVFVPLVVNGVLAAVCFIITFFYQDI